MAASSNSVEITVPSWIDKKFLENLLKKTEKDEHIQITEYEIVAGSKKSDHFASIIFKANISFTSIVDAIFHRSMIIKIPPFEEGFKKDTIDTGIFDTEIKMYEEILPVMTRLLKESGDNVKFSPRLIYASNDPYIIILENIKQEGFNTKPTLYEFEDAKLIFRKLAKWHAVTLSMKDSNPDILTLKRTVFSEESRPFFHLWIRNLELLCDIIKTWNGYEKFVPKLMSIKEKIFDKVTEIVSMNSKNPFNVLTHGDFHYKNMMHNENLEDFDIIFHDFQFCAFTTVALDIVYALYDTVSADVRDNHRNDILNVYYDQFIATLSNIGYMSYYPTKKELYMEIYKLGYLEVIMATTFLPFIQLDFSRIEEIFPELKDIDYQNPENFVKIAILALQHPDYVKLIKKYLPMFLHKGFLDL